MDRPRQFVRWARWIGHLTWAERRELALVFGLAMWCEALIRWRPLPELARRFNVVLGTETLPATDEPLDAAARMGSHATADGATGDAQLAC